MSNLPAPVPGQEYFLAPPHKPKRRTKRFIIVTAAVIAALAVIGISVGAAISTQAARKSDAQQCLEQSAKYEGDVRFECVDGRYVPTPVATTKAPEPSETTTTV